MYCMDETTKSFIRLTLVDKIHKFLSCLSLFKGTAEITRSSNRVLLFHTAHLHAHMFSLYHDDNSLWM